ncbi:species-specific tRNA processing [Maudiozyma exigua]|uniref:Species-specific tRNA processing n=1 Tax=Maudiozyma exigua TaxID=34358 RepID=A0A9P6WC87_MAUEX|nr:species-specific tRNA processing [Kazachstania exigua]
MPNTPADNKYSPGVTASSDDRNPNQVNIVQSDINRGLSNIGSLFNKNTSSSKADAAIKMSHSSNFSKNDDIVAKDTPSPNKLDTTTNQASPFSNNNTILNQLQKNYNKLDPQSHMFLHRDNLPITPDSNNNSPNDVQLNKNNQNKKRNYSSLNQSLTSSPDIDTSIEGANKDGDFVCHYCDARFKMRGYLTRHIKKHALEKAYYCPFFNDNLKKEDRCHTTGGFSRRDTYKTHMKARHFKYPDGVKPADRNKFGGHCNACNEYFTNANIWIKDHIENGQCKGLPKEYVRQLPAPDSKQRITNRLKMIKTSTGHARYISTMESVVEPNVLLNKEALEAMVIVAKDANRNDVLSKFGDDKLILNSDNFKGYKKPKRKYKKRTPKVKQTTGQVDENFTDASNTPGDFTQSSVTSSNVATPHLDTPINTPHPVTEKSTLNYPINDLDLENRSVDDKLPEERKISIDNKYPSDNISIEISPKHVADQSLLNNEPIPLDSFAYPNLINKHEDFVIHNKKNNKNNNTTYHQTNTVFALDSEQQTSYPESQDDAHYKNDESTEHISINKMLEEQYVPERINETQLEETKEYLKFYNDFFSSGL